MPGSEGCDEREGPARTTLQVEVLTGGGWAESYGREQRLEKSQSLGKYGEAETSEEQGGQERPPKLTGVWRG